MSMAQQEFAARFARKLDSFGDGLSGDLGSVRAFGDKVAEDVLRFLVECACRSQSSDAIEQGRRGLQSLPRVWLFERLVEVSRSALDLDDEYELRRLLEVCVLLDDADTTRRFVEAGRHSRNPDCSETAEEFAQRLPSQPPRLRRIPWPAFVVSSQGSPSHAAP